MAPCIDCGCDTSRDTVCGDSGCNNRYVQCVDCDAKGTSSTTYRCHQHFARPLATCIDCGIATTQVLNCEHVGCSNRVHQCSKCYADNRCRCTVHGSRPTSATLKRKLEEITKDIDVFERAAKTAATAAAAANVPAAAKVTGPTPGAGEYWGVQYYCKQCQHDRWFQHKPENYSDIWADPIIIYCHGNHRLSRPADLRRVCIIAGTADGAKEIKLTVLPEGCNKDAI